MSSPSPSPSGSTPAAYPVPATAPGTSPPQSAPPTSCLYSMMEDSGIDFARWGRMASALPHYPGGHRPPRRSTIHSRFRGDEMQRHAVTWATDHGYRGIMSLHLWIRIGMAKARSHEEYSAATQRHNVPPALPRRKAWCLLVSLPRPPQLYRPRIGDNLL